MSAVAIGHSSFTIVYYVISCYIFPPRAVGHTLTRGTCDLIHDIFTYARGISFRYNVYDFRHWTGPEGVRECPSGRGKIVEFQMCVDVVVVVVSFFFNTDIKTGNSSTSQFFYKTSKQCADDTVRAKRARPEIERTTRRPQFLRQPNRISYRNRNDMSASFRVEKKKNTRTRFKRR